MREGRGKEGQGKERGWEGREGEQREKENLKIMSPLKSEPGIVAIKRSVCLRARWKNIMDHRFKKGYDGDLAKHLKTTGNSRIKKHAYPI